MKSFTKILALGAVIAASSSAALADQLSVNGYDTFDPNTITFVGPYSAGGGTGIFAPLNGGTVTVDVPSLTYSYPGPYNVAVFTITNGGVTDTFYATSATPNPSIGSFTYPGATGLNLDIIGMGYFAGSNISGTLPASFEITSQGENGTTPVTFSGTGIASMSTAVTPEPNSLILLGTGLMGAAGMLFNRRRNAADIA